MQLRQQGGVIWITGLSGAGKSTLALEITRELRAPGRPVVMLDGDELRELFGAATSNAANHGREGRLALAMRYASLCRLIASQGIIVVLSTISMFREIHIWNREHLPRYFEVYLKVSIEELRRRDPKGIYQRFDAGEISNVAGLDVAVDEPEAADYVVEYAPGKSVSEVAEQVISSFLKSLRDV